MTHRDYKDRKPVKERRRPAAHKRSPGMLKATLLAILIGGSLAGVALWKIWPQPGDFKVTESVKPLIEAEVAPPAQPEQAQPAPAEGAGNPQTVPGGTSTTPGDFTFYDILPGKTVAKPLPEQPVQQWWIQVAALRNKNDAEALRVKLILLNFQPSVYSFVNAGGTTYYRVRLGPFTSAERARQDLQNLKNNKYSNAKIIPEEIKP